MRSYTCQFLFLLITTFFIQDVQAQTNKQITLEDIFTKGTFRSEMVSGFRSMKDGRFYSEINENGELQQVRFEDGGVEKVIAGLKGLEYQGAAIKVEDYAFNADETKLLLFTASEAIYRRSILYKTYLFDIQQKELSLLRDEKVLHPTFSPLGDKIAYVFQQNLYYYDLSTDKTVAITTDGNANILNGNCDWVYEEEFEFTRAYEWSGDGTYIAYYQFDQTKVPEYSFSMYDKLYPTEYRYKYPKAGEQNAVVEIKAYHFRNHKHVYCDIGMEEDQYIPRIKIHPFDQSLIVYRLNRLQNHLDLLQVNAQNGKSTIIYTEQSKTYVEIHDNIYWFAAKNACIYTSEKDGFMHLYYLDIETGGSTQITKGNWEVAGLLGVDESKERMYYSSAEQSPLERNVYAISFDGSNPVNITPEKGWHDVTFSNGFDYFLDVYSYLNTPSVYRIRNNAGAIVRVLKDNQALKQKMSAYALSDVSMIQVPNAEGLMLNGWILKPADFDPSRKYPLLMFQYSGPGSQSVMNKFGIRDYWWNQMLAQQGYIVVCVDGTGTGLRGEAFKKKTYLQLGKYESDDQIAVARYFAKQPYIDAKRIGIWGWSYGGYMSSICLLKGNDVFKTAIAVAPVTNWRYYDNIYTERYMRTPQENAAGYDDNSPTNMVDRLNGNYLLIHGTADDNVHLQNSYMMIDALIKANKDFDSEMYPNKNHGIGGAGTRLHLYRRMTDFILQKL
jgi:dipeptidyl-peptidase 4